PEINGEFSNLPGGQGSGVGLRSPVAGAHDPALQVLRIAVRPDVDQLGREVGIGRGRSCIQLDHDWPGHLEVLGQRLTRIHEHILPRFHLPLVVDADQTRERVQAGIPPPCRDGITWIVYITIWPLLLRRSLREWRQRDTRVPPAGWATTSGWDDPPGVGSGVAA